ncbi:MAG: hypothetical protein ABFS24_11335 [Pseudomonadota bacterium]
MLRNAFIVFLTGWVIWFWIDKPPPEQQRLPEVSDSLVENFQVAFDILKAGYPKVAYVYIWNAHYLLLSLVGGVLLAVTIGAVSDVLGRRRMRRRIMPPAPVARETGSKDSAPEQQSAPVDE